MIDFKLFQFASLPRTGVGWFLRATEAIGLKRSERREAFSEFTNLEDDDAYRISLVRHPCSWLLSCYKSIEAKDADHLMLSLNTLPHETFEEFVRAYLQQLSGAYGMWMNMYKANSYLRIEDVPHTFEESMLMLNISYAMAQRCRGVAKLNISHSWNPTLHRLVMESEKELCETFDYY